jgi:hypothetical protein
LHWQKKKEEGEIDPVIIIIIPTYIPLSNDGDANYANEDIKTIIKRSSGEYVLVDPPHTMRGFRGYTVWPYHTMFDAQYGGYAPLLHSMDYKMVRSYLLLKSASSSLIGPKMSNIIITEDEL